MTTYLMLGVYMVINFLDFVMLYYLCRNIERRRFNFRSWHHPMSLDLKNTDLQLKLPLWGWGILYGSILGFAQYSLTGYPPRLVGILFFVLTLQFLFKYSLSDALLIYAYFFLWVFVLQGPFFFLIIPLPLHQTLQFLIIQVLTITSMLPLCYKAKLFHIFNYVKTNMLLKMLIFIIEIVILTFYFYFHYEHDPAYIIFFLSLIILIAFALTHLWLRLHQRLEVDVSRAHFIANKILALHFTAQMIEDVEVMRQEIKDLLAHVNPNASEIPTITGHMNEKMLAFIEEKKKQHQLKVNVVTELNHYADHQEVKPGLIFAFLGALLDNAFEVETDKPILVDYGSIHHSCHLTVSNEYFKKSDAELDMMFEKGYSTKAEEGRGYGLHELRQEIIALGGRIDCFDTYNETYEAYYLTFVIEFRN